MKICRMFLITALAASPFFAVQTGVAQAVATAFLTSSPIGPNGSFTLSLGVTTNFVSSGYTVFYTVSANGSSLFQLTARTNDSPINGGSGTHVFNDPTTTDAVAFGGNAGLLNPTNDFDLGYTGDQTNNQSPGTFALQTVTIHLDLVNTPPGAYQIFLDPRSVMTDRTGGGFADVQMTGNPSVTLIIPVVPEPAAVGLFVIGGAMLLGVAWRKRAART